MIDIETEWINMQIQITLTWEDAAEDDTLQNHLWKNYRAEPKT